MALIKCPECGHTVSSRALNCLNCGYPLVHKIQPNKDGGNLSLSNNPQYIVNSVPQNNQPNPLPQYAQQPSVEKPRFVYQDEEDDGDKTGYYSLMTTAVIFYIIAALDFCLGNFAKIDFTGVWWSPIAFGGIGSLVEYFAKRLKS